MEMGGHHSRSGRCEEKTIIHGWIPTRTGLCSSPSLYRLSKASGLGMAGRHIMFCIIAGKSNKKTPWPESASELYRPSDCSLSAKLVPTFADRGVLCGQRDGSIRPYSRFSKPEPLLFLSSSSSVALTKLSGPRSRPTTSHKIW
jgi:hypothetical protein